MRIVQLANFYGPRSGGLRTALTALGAGYVSRGHEVTLVVPGHRPTDEWLPGGIRRIQVPAPQLPGTGGYRAVDPWRVQRLLDRLRPDAIEVSDRLTLRGLGAWAARRGIPSVVVSHERLDRLLHQFLMPERPARALADVANGRMAAAYDTVVCTTGFARAEFDRIGAANVRRVPLGVDLDTFSPLHRDAELRRELAAGARTLLVHCGRLSPEKHPERSVDAVAALHDAGASVRLVVAGDGPRRAALERRADGLPVTFIGFVPQRRWLATLLASADVSIAPGPHETFGLSALEALASGTPVVVSRSSALPEIVTGHPACAGPCGADPVGADSAAGDRRGAGRGVADRQGEGRRGADRHAAERHGAELHGAELHGADRHGAELHGAALHGAELHGAERHGAELHDAALHGAELHGAERHGAELHGAAAADSPEGFAAGITTLLAADEEQRRHAARTRAEQFGWPSSVDGMLATLTAS